MAVAGESMLSRGLITTKNPCISFKNNVSATPSLPRGCQLLKPKYCRLRTKVQVNVVKNEKTLKSDLSLGLDVVSEGELREKGFLGMRKTKMVCTIGPACCSMEDIERLAMGGMNVARLNMCHNTRDWHLDVIRRIKILNHEKGFCVSVMIDTEGSQIHVVDHGERTSVKVEEDSIWLFTAIKFEGSRPFTAQANYAGFSEGIEVGDELVIDGGMASFEVIQKVGNDLRCKCTDPGLFLPRAKLSFWRQGKLVERNYGLPTLSKKIKNFIFMSALQDWDDIEFGIAEGVDFIAMSFVSDADSVRHLKKYISTISSKSIKVLAKIETLESLQKLEEIVEASDGIMVARGDLGVQIPLEQIPTVQEKITQVCRQLNKPVIVASQLLESMVEYPIPTRAEVADVSEAIRQYADALMLSGESAIGPNGLKAISVLRMASSRMELWHREENRQSSLLDHPQLGASLEDRIADQICTSAVDMANYLGVDAIFVYTKHGHMASLLSGNRPNPPIFAFTNEDSTRKAMNLQWGVIPLLVDLSDDMDANIANTIDLIKRKGMLKNGDVILVVSDLTPAHFTSTAFQSIQVKTIV